MIGSLLGLWLAVAPAVAVPEAASATATCPAPKTVAPRYPIDMMRKNKTGTAIVEARVDACGRVLETRLAESAGYPQLNAAAQEAVAIFVFTPEAVAAADDGWVKVPMKFGGARTVTTKAIDWPRSHRRPRYLLDDSGTGFATIAEFKSAKIEDTSNFLRPPYGMVRDGAGSTVATSLYPDRSAPLTHWFTYVVHPPLPEGKTAPPVPTEVQAIARYRLVEEAGVPVVRIAILCERPADECARLSQFLLAGLPFAKPR